jgi:predicted acyltransferase
MFTNNSHNIRTKNVKKKQSFFNHNPVWRTLKGISFITMSGSDNQLTPLVNNSDSAHPESNNRLLSLDVLRGFDMFWITGGAYLINTLAGVYNTKWLTVLKEQMEHVPWNGFHFLDLIFPLFMFISGVAIPYSIKSGYIKNKSRRAIWLKALRRMIVMILLGLLYNGVFQEGFTNARYVSVLSQIGISYFFAFLIIIYSRSLRTVIFWLSGILAVIAFIQLFVPVPGIGAGILTPEGCINGYIDRLLLPGRLAYGHEGMLNSGKGIYDALGILCIVSATGITLMGAVAGNILQRTLITGHQKVGILSVIGIALILIAFSMEPFYPIIKNCWTTTFNVLAGGISFLLLALFYFLIDVSHIQKWSFYFKVIGMNSIFVYLLVRIIPVREVVVLFLGWITKPIGESGNIVIAIGSLAGVWLLLYIMYKKNFFIKV